MLACVPPKLSLNTVSNITNYTQITQTPDAGAGVFNPTNGTYTLTPDGDLTSVTFRISFKVVNSAPNGQNLKLGLYVDNDGGGYEQLKYYELGLNPNEELIANFAYVASGYTLQNGGIVPKFIVKNELASNFTYLEWINFQISNQNPAPFVDAGSSEDFWSTGSAPIYGQWLTASAFLSQNYALQPISLLILQNIRIYSSMV